MNQEELRCLQREIEQGHIPSGGVILNLITLVEDTRRERDEAKKSDNVFRVVGAAAVQAVADQNDRLDTLLARLDKAESERDEARKRYCLARALLYAEGWETARAVCERTWPDVADALFPVEAKQ